VVQDNNKLKISVIEDPRGQLDYNKSLLIMLPQGQHVPGNNDRELIDCVFIELIS